MSKEFYPTVAAHRTNRGRKPEAQTNSNISHVHRVLQFAHPVVALWADRAHLDVWHD